ncbi:MAG TPA: VOC family protein [Candidatus Sulfotelmatobacter sp.]|nr:VOC family protein [Candidatus Sulfotelmatobacter sp.]
MRFYTDSLAFTYSNVGAAKQWWIETFDCKVADVPDDWDNTLPSDVALKFPQDDQPTILLSAQAEVDQAKFDRPSPVAFTVYCDKLKKAHELLSARGVVVGPIQDGGDMKFFDMRDIEGHLIQVCDET